MEFLKKHKKALVIIISILCFLSMAIGIFYKRKPDVFDNTLGYIISPLNKAVTSTRKFFSSRIDFFINIDEIANDNDELTRENEKLAEENQRLRLMEEENIELNELLNMSQKYPKYPKIGAIVISKNPGNWYNTFLIDKGSSEGIQKNMVVISKGGLVGKIDKVYKNCSRVVSIIEDATTVSGQSARTKDVGYLKGGLGMSENGLYRMQYIDIEAEIIEGDEIVTSNLSEVYPPGILIGNVREIKADVSGLYKYALIEHSVDFENIETVLVINRLFGENTNLTEE